MCNYWLHRISYQPEVSYPLLQNFGFLSIGFSEMLDEDNLINLLQDKRINIEEKYKAIENFMSCKWGRVSKSRFSLYNFLFEFNIGDIVIIPSGKEFFVYKIVSKWQPVYEALDGKLSSNDKFVLKDKHIYQNNVMVDLGFLIKVEKVIQEAIPRNGYCDNDLLKKLKSFPVNVSLNNVQKNVDEALERFRVQQPINIYEETVKSVDNALLEIIKNKISPVQFEKLIKWYFEKIGADTVEIPSKNEKDKEEYADADVIAVFENLRVIIFVQAKQHTGTTSSWAVEQISKYYIQKSYLEDYTYIPWVISTCDDFSEEAKIAAVNFNGNNNSKVRLIDGLEFAHMLLDAGIKDINDAFE